MKTLDETRKLISRKYMGRGGIHGVGARPDSGIIFIYLSETSSPNRESLFEEIEKIASPYRVVRVETQQAVFL